MIRLCLRPFPRSLGAAGLFMGCLLASSAAFAGDAAAGSKVFKTECSECHSTIQGHNKKGPSLFGVIGRTAGTLPTYHYSDALPQTHWVWSADTLQHYLSKRTKEIVPGTKMKYDGLDDSKQLEDLITYLSTLHS